MSQLVTSHYGIFQYVFLYECFERIQEEKQWRHKILSNRQPVAAATSTSTASEAAGASNEDIEK